MAEMALGVFCPHPPLLVPQVGGAELALVGKTRSAMETMARKVREAEPEVVVIISPHAPLFASAFSIWELPEMQGDFAGFGAPDVSLSFKLDLALAARIAAREERLVRLNRSTAGEYDLPVRLDHGCLVPLYYLKQAGVAAPILPLGMSLLPSLELYKFGRSIKDAVSELGRRAVVIASGDLSHALTEDAPCGFSPQGAVFDRQLVDKLARFDLKGLIALTPQLAAEARQCGLNSLLIMLGAFDGLEAKTAVLSYEGPFGVGYCNCLLEPTGKATKSLIQGFESERQRPFAARRANASEPVALAIRAVETYVTSREVIDPRLSGKLMTQRGGAFVSIKKNGQLRGCIGTITATKPNLGQEIIFSAVAAAAEDPRFPPIEPEELSALTYSVDLLTEPERISSISQLDPERFGIIVKAGGRQGLLLPALEGIHTPAQQLSIVRRKAGILPGEKVELYRFEAVRYQ